MTVWMGNIEDPATRKMLCLYIAEKTVDALIATLGSGFQIHDAQPKFVAFQSWRAVQLDIQEFDKIELAIEKVRNDIVTTGVRNFLRMTEVSRFPQEVTIVEKGGICLAVCVIWQPVTMIQIDYIGWK